MSYIPSQNLQIAANFASFDGADDDQMLEIDPGRKLTNTDHLLRLQTKIAVFKQIKKHERENPKNAFGCIESCFFPPVTNNLKILLKSEMSKPCSSMKHPLYIIMPMSE